MLSKNLEISHYRLVRQLGAGGMGVVWEAEDLTLGRHVALKFLPDRLSRDEQALQRLSIEARSASALNHPNICTIYEIGEATAPSADDGRSEHLHFLAMEFLEGESLDHRLQRQPLEVGEILDLSIQIADALDTAHAKGIIHRDVKPANIFLTKENRAKVLDFGLAKLSSNTLAASASTAMATADSRLTSPGMAVGTVAYMSPEQARGKELDARSDIFSFGAVLYEMTTGRMPFDGDTSAVMFDAILNRDPTPPLESNPNIPAKLDEIIRTALEKDRDLRYQSAAEIRAELKRLKRDTSSGRTSRASSGSGVVAAAPSGAVKTADNSTPRVIYYAAVVCLLAILTVGGMFAWQRWFAMQQMSLANMTVSHLTSDGRVGNVAVSPDGRYVVVAKLDGEKQALVVRQIATGSDVTIVPPAIAVIWGIAFSPDGNWVYFTRSDKSSFAFSYLYKIPVLGGTPQQLIRDVDGPISFAPDGKEFVLVRGVPEKRLVKVIVSHEDGNDRELTTISAQPNRASLYGASWSPDGKTIALTTVANNNFNSKYTLWRVDARTGEHKAIYEQERPIGRPVWMPDSRSVIVSMVSTNEEKWRWQIWQLPLSGKAPIRLTNDASFYLPFGVDLTRDKTLLTALDSNTVSDIWYVPGGDAARMKQISNDESTFSAIWLADGRLLVPTQRGWAIQNPDGSNQTPIEFSKPYPGNLNRCGDRYLIYDANDNSKRDIWRMDADGGNPTQLTHDGTDAGPQCSPDGKNVYFRQVQGTAGALWKMNIDGSNARKFIDDVSGGGEVSRDGKYIAITRQAPPPGPATVIFAETETGRETPPLALPPGAGSFMLAPDSKHFQFSLVRNSVGNLWQVPITGGEPVQITKFSDPMRIGAASWSRDGKDLVISRPRTKTDVVLMRSNSK